MAIKKGNFALFGLNWIAYSHLVLTIGVLGSAFITTGVFWLILHFSNFLAVFGVITLIRLLTTWLQKGYRLNLYSIIDNKTEEIIYKVYTIKPLSDISELKTLHFMNDSDELYLRKFPHKIYKEISLKEFIN